MESLDDNTTYTYCGITQQCRKFDGPLDPDISGIGVRKHLHPVIITMANLSIWEGVRILPSNQLIDNRVCHHRILQQMPFNPR